MDPAATAVWPAGGRAYEAYEDYARSYLPMSGHPPPGTANLAWQPPQPGLDTDRQHEDTVGIKIKKKSFYCKRISPGLIKLTQSLELKAEKLKNV